MDQDDTRAQGPPRPKRRGQQQEPHRDPDLKLAHANATHAPWRATAAYLYLLSLDGPELAWEYLRRHPDYRQDWERRRHAPSTARHWGLSQYEDPRLDAREALPCWLDPPLDTLQVHPDPCPGPEAPRFDFWHLPGRKQMAFDCSRLHIKLSWPGERIRLSLSPELEPGQPTLYAIPATSQSAARCKAVAHPLGWLDHSLTPDWALPQAQTAPRPGRTALLEVHTLQALDAHLSGASHRDFALALYDAQDIAQHWHADGDMRARVRRLMRRGLKLMHSGHLQLITPIPPISQIPKMGQQSPPKGRSAHDRQGP